MITCRLAIACAAMLLTVSNRAAQPYQPTFADPLRESFRWNRIPELTEKSFYCMAEGPTGVMWFGVRDGACSYDGVVWKSYRPEGDRDISVRSICVAADGMVYATDGQSVWILHGGDWERLVAPVEIRQWDIYKLTWTSDGSLWLGTNYGLVRFVDGRTAHAYGPKRSLDRLREAGFQAVYHEVPSLRSTDDMCPVYNVEPARSKQVLVRTRDGIYSFEHLAPEATPDRWQELSQLKKYWHPLRAAVVCGAADGAVWGLSDNGIVERIEDGKSKTWDLRELVNGDVTVSIAECPDGSIWVGGQGSLFVFRDGAWQAYAQPEIPSGGAARIMVLPASDGSVWIGSEQNNVYRIDYSRERWLTIENLNYFVETRDGRRWFLDKAGRVVVADEGLSEWQVYDRDDGIIDAPVVLFVTSQDQLWCVGGEEQEAAVCWLDEQGWHLKSLPGICWSFDYRSVYEALDGTLWFGAAANTIPGSGQTGGIVRYDPKLGAPSDDRAWTRVRLHEDRASTYGISQTANGTMWFGGISLLACDPDTGAEIAGIPLPFPSDARVDNLRTTPDHRLWVATRNYGVASFDGTNWRHFDVGNGLPHNTIIDVLEVSNGDVLLSTDLGISRFDGVAWTNRALPEEFDMMRESGEFRQTSDGAIWINIGSRGWKRRGVDGDRYNPERQQFWTCRHFPDQQPPVTQITLYEPEVSPRGNTVIAWKGTDRWHATAPEDLQYSYRFDDGEWSPFTAVTQSVFTSLDSGQHTFEVRARDMDFNVDSNPPRIRFHVTPPLWRQAWFVGMMGLLVVAALVGVRSYGVHRWNNALREINSELEHRVAQRTTELEESNRELESFAHSVSHDLRAPLRAVEGFALALQEDYGETIDEQGREYLQLIAGSASRMDLLIRDLLEYSRLSRADLKVKPTDLGEVVRSALAELAADVESTGAHISVGEHLPSVMGHRATLIRVVMNLLSNALKFVRPGTPPEVTIWTEPGSRGRIRLLVEDRGIGIEQRHLKRIFHMFERLHGVESYPGTGVGLAIVIRACERLGGSCGVDSVPGQGSRFWVELPESGS